MSTKPGGGSRSLARLDARSDTGYRWLVGRFAARIERSLGPGVFANRTDAHGRVRPWLPARAAWEDAIGRTLAREGARAVLAVSDVRSCYASIGDEALRCAGIDDDDLLRLLRTFRDLGARGLPVGPDPSAVLANAVLAVADRAVLAAAGRHPIRWVDDVIFVAASRRDAVRALDAWRRALGELGLEPNEEKTRVMTGGEGGARSVLGRSASAAQRTARGIIAWP